MEPLRYITVSELNRLLNLVLEDNLPEVYFEGEISELNLAASGHLYCTLKDNSAEVRIILWAQTVQSLKFRPECGAAVRCHGRPNVYQKSGRLQIIVDRMFPAGEGELKKKFLELKAKLEKEGLFAPERKRKLPFLPRAIGVVTSAAGAAIHDIMVKLRERMPQIPVYLVDVRVQGEGSAQDIAAGLDFLAGSSLVDVIIVGRGGGSLEDLWSFNEEIVARAVFASPVPVISAVGHEVDVSLCDLVADVRAPTPTAAAEMVVPRRADLLACIEDCEARLSAYQRWFEPLVQQLDELSLKLKHGMRNIINAAALRIAAAGARLRTIEPGKILALFASRLDSLWEKLCRQAADRLNAAASTVDRLQARLAGAYSPQRLSLLSEKVRFMENRLQTSITRRVQVMSHRLQNASDRLQALNPRGVLERGYAIVESRGKIITSSAELELEELIKILFAKGAVKAAVKERMD